MESFEQLSLWVVALLVLANIATALISGVIGMAGGVTLLGILTFFLPLNWIVPIHGVIQLVSNSTRAFLIRDNVRWDMVVRYAIGAVFGTAASAHIFTSIENKALPLAAIGFLILYSLFKPKKLPPIMVPLNGFIGVGIVAGFISLFVGAVGPFLAPFFLRPDLNQKQLVSTKAAFQTITHVLKLPAFLYIGFHYLDHWALIGILCIAAVVGTKIGVSILNRINERVFFILFRSLLFLASLRVFYKVYQELGISL